MSLSKKQKLIISLVSGLIFLIGPISSAQELTFEEAINRGLKNNHKLIKQQAKIASLQRELAAVKAGTDWKWETEIEPRVVSVNTETTSQKDLAQLAGEKTFWPGLTLEPEVYLPEEEVIEEGWEKAKVNFAVELEQPIYPFAAPQPQQDYQAAKLELTAARAKLQQIKQEQRVDWLSDYLELIELALEQEITKQWQEVAKQELKQVQRKYKTGEVNRQEVVAVKIDVNEANQDVQEANNDYQQVQRDLVQKLGLKETIKLTATPTDDFAQQWTAKLETKLPDLTNVEQLINLAVANSKQLAITELDKKQLKRELNWQAAERKPEVNFKADYDSDDQDWQVGLNLTYDLFDSGEYKLARQELTQELAEVKREYQSQLRELKARIKKLVGEIKTEELKLTEQELRLEEVTLELETVKKEFAQDTASKLDYQEQQLEVMEARLDLKEAQHQLMVDKYELLKLIGKNKGE